MLNDLDSDITSSTSRRRQDGRPEYSSRNNSDPSVSRSPRSRAGLESRSNTSSSRNESSRFNRPAISSDTQITASNLDSLLNSPNSSLNRPRTSDSNTKHRKKNSDIFNDIFDELESVEAEILAPPNREAPRRPGASRNNSRQVFC